MNFNKLLLIKNNKKGDAHMKHISIADYLEKADIIRHLQDDGWFPEKCNTVATKTQFRSKSRNFYFQDGILWFIGPNNEKLRFFCDSEIKDKLDFIKQHHDLDHAGRDKLEVRLKSILYGFKRQEILSVCDSCIACKMHKRLRTRMPLRPIRTNAPRERYMADMVDLRYYSSQNDEYCWILNIIDCYSKFLFSYKLKTKSAMEVSSCFQHAL